MGKVVKRQKELPLEAVELERSLQETRARIAQAYAGFNWAADSELVESYIYEIQALQARYSYLLRRRKALEPDQPLESETLEMPGPQELDGPSALPVA